MQEPSYTYRARVMEVYDADTITVNIDLGFHSGLSYEKVRLFGINAPEVRGEERPEGLDSRDYLRSLILNKDVIMETFKDSKGKYGRWLANIWLDGMNVNEHLVETGYAKWHEY